MFKREMNIIVLLCYLICILFLNSALADCPVEIYGITGRIVRHEGTPIENALVLIFFDEESFGCSSFTLATGQYGIRCMYDTYKRTSFFSGDICGEKPSSITIVVYAEDYDPKRIVMKAEKVKTKDEEYVFTVPPIILHQKPSTQEESQETPTEVEQETQE